MGTEQHKCRIWRRPDPDPRRVWRQSANDRECTSEALPHGDSIIWYMRSWTMRWMRLWPDFVIRLKYRSSSARDNTITVIDNGRGIPVGINHKSGPSGCRGRLYDPSCRRKIRRWRIQGVRRTSRRRSLCRKCAFHLAGGSDLP